MKNRHIEIIRERLGVAFTTISLYHSAHKDEIEHIDEIFDLKGNNKEKVLALLYMLSSDKEDNAIQRYRKETELNGEQYDPEVLLENYKTLLITALVYNRALYAMAVNYRGFVNAGLAIGEVENDSIEGIEPSGSERMSDEKRENIKGFFPRRRHVYQPRQRELLKTADSTGYAPFPFGDIIHWDDIDDMHCGDLICMGNRKSRLLELRFQFFDKKTKQPVSNIPFKLNVEIILDHDKSHYNILLDQEMNSSTIRSAAREINFIDGFEVYEIIEI